MLVEFWISDLATTSVDSQKLEFQARLAGVSLKDAIEVAYPRQLNSCPVCDKKINFFKIEEHLSEHKDSFAIILSKALSKGFRQGEFGNKRKQPDTYLSEAEERIFNLKKALKRGDSL